MERRTFHLTSLVGSTAPVPLHPTHDYAEQAVKGPQHVRTMDGRLYSYRLAGEAAYQFAMPLTYVTSALRTELTTWWREGRQAMLTFNLSSNPKSAVVHIAGAAEPLGGWHPTLLERRQGVLQLEDVRGVGVFSGGPFITDDADWGTTDTPHNVTP